MSRNKLYLVLILLITAGYCWLGWSLTQTTHNINFTPCPIKNITGIACPSCGSTRSVSQIIQGNFADAFMLNPFGYIIALAMLIGPIWLLFDLISKKDTLHRGYHKFEQTLKIKWIAIVLILLTLANWAWNIYKEL
ncbi:DUF2752 domain-containing protein [Flavobacterium sp. ST-75]|uniref:DUF2752 domain-containing protein n=1 Tax=Flavobacterium rhizophilum TaxID=3163296 RepID=A0ABW8YAY2_9FLAO